VTIGTGYKIPPQAMPDEQEHRRQLAQAIERVMRGKINAVTTVTLTASSTTTTMIDARIGASTFIGFSPTTANAAAAAANLYVSAQKNGQATLTHASSANVDQTFSVLLIG
jgi:hypothetical protein